MKIQAMPSPGSHIRTVPWRQKGFGSFLYEGSIGDRCMAVPDGARFRRGI
ncbi:hypothetical protein ACSS6W_001485 [Trichoderma asperelloides]